MKPSSPMRDLTAVYPVADKISSENISTYPLKRGFDFILALLALMISFPLWFIFAIAIKIEGGGPILYSQKRWGKGKKPIRVYKFRTMIVDADQKIGPIQAQENDSRITYVGKLLRATSLDELPQILNILRGEMSWVGPRALPLNEVQIKEGNGYVPDDEIPGFELRCKVRPGLTGMAQVYAPRDVPRRHKFRYDLMYIQNESLWLDLKLIALSLWITFRGRWEDRGRKL